MAVLLIALVTSDYPDPHTTHGHDFFSMPDHHGLTDAGLNIEPSSTQHTDQIASNKFEKLFSIKK